MLERTLPVSTFTFARKRGKRERLKVALVLGMVSDRCNNSCKRFLSINTQDTNSGPKSQNALPKRPQTSDLMEAMGALEVIIKLNRFFQADISKDQACGGALPATAGVTAGDVFCSSDGSGSSGMPCCDEPKGTVMLLSRSWHSVPAQFHVFSDENNMVSTQEVLSNNSSRFRCLLYSDAKASNRSMKNSK